MLGLESFLLWIRMEPTRSPSIVPISHALYFLPQCGQEISRVVTHHNLGQFSLFLVLHEVKAAGLFSNCPR